MTDETAFTPCDFCTGSRWLQDTEFLGPCACVTPLNLKEANDEIERIDSAPADALDAMHDVLNAMHQYLQSVGLDPRAIVYDNPHLDAVMDVLNEWE